jgi:hypothetical protein
MNKQTKISLTSFNKLNVKEIVPVYGPNQTYNVSPGYAYVISYKNIPINVPL